MIVRTGLGDAEKVVLTQTATAAASTAVAGAATAGLLTASVAGPIGLAIAGAGILFSFLFGRKGGQQKIQASKDVDSIEPAFQQNLGLFQSGQIDKQTALNNFDKLWTQVVQMLSDPNLGDAGKRGLEERGRNGRPPWGKNWFELYRDPIEQAPDQIAFNFGGDDGGMSYLIPAGLLLAAVIL